MTPPGTSMRRAFPSLYDISDSAHWYNRPEVGIIVWRGKDERTIVRVAKSRYHDEIGVPGDIAVRYVRERSTFEAALSARRSRVAARRRVTARSRSSPTPSYPADCA